MVALVVVLEPEALSNPDTDLAILVPDAIEASADGLVVANGWGYAENNAMHLFFECYDQEKGIECVRRVLSDQSTAGNDLSAAIIAVRSDERGPFTGVFPPRAVGLVVEDIDA